MTCANQWKDFFGMFRFLYKDDPTRKTTKKSIIIQHQQKKDKRNNTTNGNKAKSFIVFKILNVKKHVHINCAPDRVHNSDLFYDV